MKPAVREAHEPAGHHSAGTAITFGRYYCGAERADLKKVQPDTVLNTG